MMMAGGPGVILSLLALLLGGGSNDLLDYLATQDYWKAKSVEVTAAAMEAELKAPPVMDVEAQVRNLGSDDFQTRDRAQRTIEAAGPAVAPQLTAALQSPDPEVVSRVQAILEHLAQSGQARRVRTLMAIRTLGELKDQAALPILRPLLTSKELFVAEYAAAAVAAIEGKSYARPRPTADQRRADLDLLPADLGAVGQLHLGGATGATSLDQWIEQGAAASNLPKDQIAAKITQGLIQALEMVGNIRVDGITLGVSDSVGPDGGYVVVMARGIYDHKAITALLGKGGPRVTAREEQGIQIVTPERNTTLILPSDEQIILLAGSNPETLPITDVLAALKTGKGAFAQNAALAKVVQTVDTTKPIWAAMTIGENYRQAPLLAPFDAMTLSVDVAGDTKSLAFKISATGSDKDKAAAAVDSLNTDIQKGLAQMQQFRQMMQGGAGGGAGGPAARPAAAASMFDPMIETMQSLKVSAEAGNATMTGTVKGQSPLGMLLPMFLGRTMHAAPVRAAPPVQVMPQNAP
jgi:hypothetical protein